MGDHEEELDINEDIDFERRSWRVQDAGAAAIGFLMAAALAGLFGSGALSRAGGESADGGASADYQRFARSDARSEMILRLRPGQERDGLIAIRVDAAYLEAFEVERITPRPVGELAGADGIRYVFAVAPGLEPAILSFVLRARGFGPARGSIGVEGRPPVELKQFVYP